MKNIYNLITCILSIFLLIGCSEDDERFIYLKEAPAPSNLSAEIEYTNDNSGEVTITPSGNGVSSYQIFFGDDTEEPVEVEVGSNVSHTYAEGTYELRVIAIGLLDKTTELLENVEISFAAPKNVVTNIVAGTSKSFQVRVSPTAEFATSFDIFFGEDDNADPVAIQPGETATYQYEKAGEYTIRVVAKGSGIATTEVSEVFEAREILEFVELPLDFESESLEYPWFGFGGSEGVAVIDNPDQSGINNSSKVVSIPKSEGAQTFAGVGLPLVSPIDFSQSTIISMKVWSPRADVPILLKIEDTSSDPDVNGNPSVIAEVSVNTSKAMAWEQLSFDMSTFAAFSTDISYDRIIVFGDFGSGGQPGGETYYIDDIQINNNLLTNGDFEDGSTSWLVGVDDSSSAPTVTVDGNTYYSVDVTAAGNPFDVNLSQKLEIVQGNTYTLTFDAWSDRDRSIVVGIGLSGPPFSAATETIDITAIQTTYSLTLTAGDFGAPDARVLFDSGAEIGIVNIDNVKFEIN